MYFQEHIYLFKYQGLIRQVLLDYKFKNKSYIYKTLAILLLRDEKIFTTIKSYDIIIPVPVSAKRLKERGYNQSSLIAKELEKQIIMPDKQNRQNQNKQNQQNSRNQEQTIKYNDKCLFKTKNIIEQSKLNKEDRLKNIQGVYELRNKQILKDKKILLVDDIYTTGSTANECSKTISQANPKKIGILTIAKD